MTTTETFPRHPRVLLGAQGTTAEPEPVSVRQIAHRIIAVLPPRANSDLLRCMADMLDSHASTGEIG